MTTYHLSIHKPRISFYDGMDTSTCRRIQLGDEMSFRNVNRMCDERTNMAGFWKQTVLPIRTDRASDLFFPTLMNLVMKTKDYAESCLAVLGAILWDIATLPIRLLTYLPRLAYNARVQPEEHPLIPYLKGYGLTAGEIEGERPFEASVGIGNSPFTRRTEADGRATVFVYKRELGVESGHRYNLYLADREIAFPTYSSSSFRRSMIVDE